ncbi:MAG: phosphatidate cytidylyltransferase [Phycisphaeraceae bacterium]
MLSQRLMTGFILIALAIGVFYFDGWVERATVGTPVPPGLLLVLPLIVIVIPAAMELAALLRKKGIDASAALLVLTSLAAGLTVWLSHRCELGAVATASVLVAAFAAALIYHARNASPPGAMASAGGTLLATVYLGLCGGLFLAIRQDHAAWVLLAVLAITKACDIGAYFTGRALGKRKLIPWLSPGKTWEGLVGGITLSVLTALAFAWLSQTTEIGTVYREVDGEVVALVQQYHLGWAALLGVLLAIVGHAGDLTMSLFKRDADVKDSGDTLPGFGGVLDVIDSPLLIAPVAYWLLTLALIN